MLVYIVFFASAACNTPGLAQSSTGYSGATATANANAVSTGGSATANAYSYASAYSTYKNGVRDCTYNSCTPTCSVPSPTNCPANSNPCNCPEGTIISQEGGQCVPLQQCQRYINCKGDYNAVPTDCPHLCPATCAAPNSERYCYSNKCGPPGCECKYGYIRSALNGKCIKPEQCPGGFVCGRNETFLNCIVECPSLYCPTSSSRVACGPSAPPCPGGCSCKYKYLRKNIYDQTCILESDCPPGKCEANEEWNRCVPLCFSDKCKDRNKVSKPGDCPFSPTECYPGCVCKKGYYRYNFSCIPAQECPADN